MRLHEHPVHRRWFQGLVQAARGHHLPLLLLTVMVIGSVPARTGVSTGGDRPTRAILEPRA